MSHKGKESGWVAYPVSQNFELPNSVRFISHQLVNYMLLSTVSLIVNIFTNFIFDTTLKFKKVTIKSDVSDLFPVFVSLSSSSKIHKENQKITIHKRVNYGSYLIAFKPNLHNFNWNSINVYPETSSKYKKCFKTFSELYERYFSLKGFQIKEKDLQASRLGKRLKNCLSKNKNCILNF